LENALAQAGAGSTAEMRSLDDQVQEIKSDVLAIAADLGRLEEKLLFPSNTQLAIFVSIPDGQMFRLDAVQITIDGDLATRYIYGFKELEALQKGGAHRIYTGNIQTGAHGIEISASGKTHSGDDFDNSSAFTFDKGIEPKLLGISLVGPQKIELETW
jgi:hypothetical protein